MRPAHMRDLTWLHRSAAFTPLQRTTIPQREDREVRASYRTLKRRKRRAPMLLIALVFAVAVAKAGSITGTVKAQGKEGTDDPACGGKYASRQFKFAERVNYEEMHDFVV